MTCSSVRPAALCLEAQSRVNRRLRSRAPGVDEKLQVSVLLMGGPTGTPVISAKNADVAFTFELRLVERSPGSCRTSRASSSRAPSTGTKARSSCRRTSRSTRRETGRQRASERSRGATALSGGRAVTIAGGEERDDDRTPDGRAIHGSTTQQTRVMMRQRELLRDDFFTRGTRGRAQPPLR